MEIASSTIEYNAPIEARAVYNQKNVDTVGLPSIKARLEEIINNLISPKVESDLTTQLNEKFLELDFGAEFDVDVDCIGVDDAIFFINILNQEQVINYSVSDNKIQLNVDNKQIKVTNSLLNMLSTSLDTKKPIRLDFENDVTVILRLDKHGKIQAHFIPGSPEVESYLKNNLISLKQTFDEEDINYSYLGYSKNKNDNRNKNRNNSKGSAQ